jgi:ribonuclease D
LLVSYVNHPNGLSTCVEKLAKSASFAVDLEFDSNNYGYGVTPSLIQLATPDACFVVDLMSSLDMQPLFALLADDRIEKLVHAPGEDLRILHRLGCFPKNLFDTEVVARLLNYEQTSQSALLAAGLGITLNKGQQRSNWLLRPLSAAQIEYAATDVVWLHALKQHLVREADERELMAFVREEQALLSETVYAQEARGDFLKPADRVAYSLWHQYVLNGLLRFRDELARRISRPPYQVMADEVVRDMATGQCTAADTLTRRGVHPRFRNGRSAAALAEKLQSLQTEADAQELSKKPPVRPRFTPAQEEARRKAAYDRQHLFLPIKEALRARFGLYATQLLLSDRLVGDLLAGVTAFSKLPPYRQALFLQTAEQLGIDLSDYVMRPGVEKK